MLAKKDFFIPYLHAMLLASMAFGVICGMHILVMSTINAITINHSDFRLSGFVTIIFLMILHSVCWLLISHRISS